MRRRILAIVLAVTAVTGLPLLLGIAIGQGVPADSRPDKEFYADADNQAFASTKGSATTDSQEFESVPGLSGLALCGRDGTSATVSLELSGGAVEVRVRVGGKTMSPGVTSFDPGEGQSSQSFTYGRSERGRFSENVDVEWRASSGETVTLHDGSLRALYGTMSRSGCA